MSVWIDGDVIEKVMTYPALIAALKQGFVQGAQMPPLLSYSVSNEKGSELFAMPCWERGVGISMKVMTAFPANAELGLSTSSALLVLFDDLTGKIVAAFDAVSLTNMRAAATSALASSLLSKPDAQVLAVIGTGQLAPYMAEAHCLVRPIETVLVWGRSLSKAQSLTDLLLAKGLPAKLVLDRAEAISRANIITAATRSHEPLVLGRDVQPRTHVDLVGGYKPSMREADDALMARADVVVDRYDAVISEAGDIVLPLESGALTRARISSLKEIIMNNGRITNSGDVTVFKSIGCGLEDLYAAKLLLTRLEERAAGS